MRSLPLLLLCLALVLLQGHPGWARGGRGGGSRGGGFRGGSSYRSSGSSYRAAAYRAYRSSGYSGMSTRRYNYYSSNSYYLSYVPTVRYTRSYSLAVMGTLYWSYYSRYYYYVGTAKYASRGTPPTNTTASVCANYAAGENGTYMGLFTCPLDFEPTTFTACCGDDYEEYCCEPDPGLPGWAIALIVIACVGGFLAFVAWCWYSNKKKNERWQATPVQTVQGSRANIHPPPGQRPNTVTGNVNYGFTNTKPQGGPPGAMVAPPPYPGNQLPPQQQNGGYPNAPPYPNGAPTYPPGGATYPPGGAPYPTGGPVPSELPPGYTPPGQLAPLEPKYGFQPSLLNPPPEAAAPPSREAAPTDSSIAPPQSAMY